MSGAELLGRAEELHRNTIRMVLSGYADMQGLAGAINRGAIWRFLNKPWDDKTLCKLVQEAFREYDLHYGKHRQSERLDTPSGP